MNRLALFISLFLVLSATSLSAIDFSNPPLASYEPSESEINDLNVSTDPCFSSSAHRDWPVLGGVGGAPQATNGDYILKLTWTNEPDHNSEARHHWNISDFDLIDINYILVDVFIASPNALPAPDKNNISIWSHWGSNDHWISSEANLPEINQWYTSGFHVGNLHYENLKDINALSFTYMNGTNGTIYIDNLRLLYVPFDMNWPNIRRKIQFSGYWWSIMQSSYQVGAGPSCFTDDPNDVFVDPNGCLHLSIKYKDPNWYCSEVITTENLGYGTYAYTVDTNTDLLDPNIVVGLFVYDVCDPCAYHEVDVELTRWGKPDDLNNAGFAVQPADTCLYPDNSSRFRVDYKTRTVVTHEFNWMPLRVDFNSYYGDYNAAPRQENIIHSWSFTEPNAIPTTAKDNPRINFYLTNGDPPQIKLNDAEVVVKKFLYLPLGDYNKDGYTDEFDLNLFFSSWLAKPGDPNWNLNCEFAMHVEDIINIINFRDFAVFAKYWRKGKRL